MYGHVELGTSQRALLWNELSYGRGEGGGRQELNKRLIPKANAARTSVCELFQDWQVCPSSVGYATLQKTFAQQFRVPLARACAYGNRAFRSTRHGTTIDGSGKKKKTVTRTWICDVRRLVGASNHIITASAKRCESSVCRDLRQT